MESLFLLIPLVVVFVIAAALLFIWAVNHGQYDDLDREAEQVLFEDDTLPSTPLRERNTISSGQTAPFPEQTTPVSEQTTPVSERSRREHDH